MQYWMDADLTEVEPDGDSTTEAGLPEVEPSTRPQGVAGCGFAEPARRGRRPPDLEWFAGGRDGAGSPAGGANPSSAGSGGWTLVENERDHLV